jgi:hypothetical protein
LTGRPFFVGGGQDEGLPTPFHDDLVGPLGGLDFTGRGTLTGGRAQSSFS